jgi:translation elongation factor EF-4
MYCPSESKSDRVTALEGYEPSKPMIFASVFPVDTVDLEEMYAAVDRCVLLLTTTYSTLLTSTYCILCTYVL